MSSAAAEASLPASTVVAAAPEFTAPMNAAQVVATPELPTGGTAQGDARSIVPVEVSRPVASGASIGTVQWLSVDYPLVGDLDAVVCRLKWRLMENSLVRADLEVVASTARDRELAARQDAREAEDKFLALAERCKKDDEARCQLEQALTTACSAAVEVSRSLEDLRKEAAEAVQPRDAAWRPHSASSGRRASRRPSSSGVVRTRRR